jgi:peptidyl-prolyl cis-trans isomerase D
MAETLYRYRHEKRTAELMAVAPIASPALSDEAALGEFHKQNAARYTAPEYRRLSYLVLEPETLAAKVKVDEAKLEEAYQQRRDEFIVPERRKMSQLRLTNEEEAKKAQDLLKQGKSLAETAKSLGDKQLEDMGLVEKGELPAEARDAVFALSEKGTSGLIKSAFGWHIFVVEAIDNGGSKSPAEAKELIAKEMKADLAGKIVYETSTKLEDALAGGANLTEAAKRLDLVLHNIASVDATGLDAAGAKIEKMPKPDRFLKTAFTISEGAESTSIETDAGYFVLRVEKITPPVLRPLETIRDKVLADWKLEQSRKLTEKRAEEVMAALKDNADFSAVAKRFKLNVIASKPMRREGRPEDEALSSAIVTELFKLKVGETTMGETQNGFTLARLKSVIAADPASDADGMKDVTEELAQILSGDLIESFSAALAIRYGVKVNRRALGELGN